LLHSYGQSPKVLNHEQQETLKKKPPNARGAFVWVLNAYEKGGLNNIPAVKNVY
jgi:hypothetical protein